MKSPATTAAVADVIFLRSTSIAAILSREYLQSLSPSVLIQPPVHALNLLAQPSQTQPYVKCIERVLHHHPPNGPNSPKSITVSRAYGNVWIQAMHKSKTPPIAIGYVFRFPIADIDVANTSVKAEETRDTSNPSDAVTDRTICPNVKDDKEDCQLKVFRGSSVGVWEGEGWMADGEKLNGKCGKDVLGEDEDIREQFSWEGKEGLGEGHGSMDAEKVEETASYRLSINSSRHVPPCVHGRQIFLRDVTLPGPRTLSAELWGVAPCPPAMGALAAGKFRNHNRRRLALLT
ncbi:hypothetical protein HDU96_000493 [Phlyctochytrium bullatum]|nr:hypothetical protein HDU96_000493 [Phlyctochytrium bullatum]